MSSTELPEMPSEIAEAEAYFKARLDPSVPIPGYLRQRGDRVSGVLYITDMSVQSFNTLMVLMNSFAVNTEVPND